MDKPPMEWIDKLFNCMNEFYGERWTKAFTKKDYESLGKTVWQSALQGLSYEEIRNTLVYLKRHSNGAYSTPPNHLEFFRIAKSASIPLPKRPDEKRCDPEVARRALDEIRAKLDGNSSLDKTSGDR